MAFLLPYITPNQINLRRNKNWISFIKFFAKIFRNFWQIFKNRKSLKLVQNNFLGPSRENKLSFLDFLLKNKFALNRDQVTFETAPNTPVKNLKILLNLPRIKSLEKSQNNFFFEFPNLKIFGKNFENFLEFLFQILPYI